MKRRDHSIRDPTDAIVRIDTREPVGYEALARFRQCLGAVLVILIQFFDLAVDPALVRLSVGIEHVDDLQYDLATALADL